MIRSFHMEINPEYELFGRKLHLDDMRNIKQVFQPGILSSPYFFDQSSLEDALKCLCGYSPKEVLVYFNNISAGFGDNDKDEKRKWWESFQRFASLLGNRFPAGCEFEYWYSSDKKNFSLPEFREDTPPYQAFVRLFKNAIQGFSCFVNQDRNCLEFSSRRCNYDTIKHGEGFIDDEHSLWTGKSDVFMESAQILYQAFYEMRRPTRYHAHAEEMAGAHRSDIRIICPERGALVGSLYGSDSMTLLVENASLKNMVKQHISRRKPHNELRLSA